MDIERYSFGEITLEGRTYRKDVIILPDRIISPWWRREGHLLQIDDLREVIDSSPELLIIGKGYSGVMEVPAALVERLREQGMQVKVHDTGEAVAAFNASGMIRKAAALHLTC